MRWPAGQLNLHQGRLENAFAQGQIGDRRTRRISQYIEKSAN
jgi:hypothetical protein